MRGHVTCNKTFCKTNDDNQLNSTKNHWRIRCSSREYKHGKVAMLSRSRKTLALYRWISFIYFNRDRLILCSGWYIKNYVLTCAVWQILIMVSEWSDRRENRETRVIIHFILVQNWRQEDNGLHYQDRDNVGA